MTKEEKREDEGRRETMEYIRKQKGEARTRKTEKHPNKEKEQEKGRKNRYSQNKHEKQTQSRTSQEGGGYEVLTARRYRKWPWS